MPRKKVKLYPLDFWETVLIYFLNLLNEKLFLESLEFSGVYVRFLDNIGKYRILV